MPALLELIVVAEQAAGYWLLLLREMYMREVSEGSTDSLKIIWYLWFEGCCSRP